MDVRAIEDELARHVRSGEGGRQAARVAVDEGPHGVEAVGDVSHAGPERLERFFVGGVGVAHAGHDP